MDFFRRVNQSHRNKIMVINKYFDSITDKTRHQYLLPTATNMSTRDKKISSEHDTTEKQIIDYIKEVLRKSTTM